MKKRLILVCCLSFCVGLVYAPVVSACASCNMAIGIAAPTGSSTIRGTSVGVSGTATDGGQGDYLAGWTVKLGSQPVANWSFDGYSHTSSWSGAMDTTSVVNGSRTLEAWAYCWQQHTASHSISVNVDNHYLLSVGRGHESSYGTLRWKRLSSAGGGWDAVAGPWDAITEGCGADTCDHQGDGGSRHSMCLNRDTPAYLKSNPSDEKSYPHITSVLDSYHDGRTGAYKKEQWPVDQGGDGNYYYVVEANNHIVGRYVVNLPAASGRCHTTSPPYNDCSRTGIQIHGGKSVTSMSEGLYPDQALKCTLGCIRMHNGDLKTLVEDYIETYDDYVGVSGIHISVPDM